MLRNNVETEIVKRTQGSTLSPRKLNEANMTMSKSPRIKKGSVEIFPSISEERTKIVKTPRQGTENHDNKIDKRRPSVATSTGSRRTSVTGNVSSDSQSKPSFRSIGGKVTTLLRAKLAFKTKRKDADNSGEESVEEIIKDLPKQPRFSSSMSPEAQYAIMKGYEDTVYSYLCKEYPEYRLFLKRNRTPASQLDMLEGVGSHKSVQQSQQHAARKLRYGSVEEESEEEDDDDKMEVTTSISSSRSPSNTLSPIPNTAGASLRRNSTSVIPSSNTALRKSVRSSSVSVQNRNVISPITRSPSLPAILPLEKQLIMTHRLQSAMDILDTVKGQLGMNFTSPRIKTNPGSIQPVSDYNKWTRVWSQEFKVKSDAKIHS